MMAILQSFGRKLKESFLEPAWYCSSDSQLALWKTGCQAEWPEEKLFMLMQQDD